MSSTVRAGAVRDRAVVRRRSAVKAKSRSLSVATNKAILFMGVALVTYILVGMAFQVKKEEARKAAGSAAIRIERARRAVLDLEGAVHEMERPDRVELWASNHGYERFASVPIPPQETTRVASNR